MEMSQRTHFLYQVLSKMTIFLRKCQKIPFFGQKNFLDSLQKTILS